MAVVHEQVCLLGRLRTLSATVLSRSPDLQHHLEQGVAWLKESAQGTNPAALSYAAFELRLAIERLAMQYWSQLVKGRGEQHDMRDVSSFKRMENRIYSLAGHERKIVRHFDFMRLVLGLLKIDHDLLTPNLSQLSKNWHQCSELCHIRWTFDCSDLQLCTQTFINLQEIAAFLNKHMGDLALAGSWPTVRDPAFANLRDRFVAGNAGSDDVRAHLREKGAWARVEYKDDRTPEFVGEAIAPNGEGASN